MEKNNIAPFYIGQRIGALSNHPDGLFKKGDEFIVTDIRKGLCKCNLWLVQIGDIFGNGNGSHCWDCNTRISIEGKLWFRAGRFAPLEETFQSISLSKVLELETPLISVN